MAQSTRRRQPALPAVSTYWDRTQWPLQSLYFLMPLLVLYEVGAWLFAPDGDGGRLPRIMAERWMGDWFEITGYYLPGLVVVVVLLCWHLVRQDSWRIEPRLYLTMWIESLLLAIPLYVFMLVLFREPASAWNAGSELLAGGEAIPGAEALSPWRQWAAGLVFSMGAGIYEEMLFRLIAIALVHLLLVDLLGLPDHIGAIAAVGFSAVAFALYHFHVPLPEPWSDWIFSGWYWRQFWGRFQFGLFLFYTSAGIYLAMIYVVRGFGIVVATHALYDVLVVTTITARHLSE